jgi:hypothetical protein
MLVGATLLLVPLVPAGSSSITYGHSFYAANLTGFSLTGAITGTLSWSANGSVKFLFLSCGKSVCNGTDASTETEQGTSGSFSFSVPSGGAIGGLIESGAPGATASIKVTLTQATYGSLLLLGGVVVLLVGLALRRKPSPAVVTAPEDVPAPAHAASLPAMPDGVPSDAAQRRE